MSGALPFLITHVLGCLAAQAWLTATDCAVETNEAVCKNVPHRLAIKFSN